MFKSVRWRSEKKIKVVFKMQFQATQVPQLGRTTLMISLVPEDVGKPTVRLQKVAVQNGTCSWENPIYETVKFIKELKTGKINEKNYHFIVSTGSSKGGFLGEVSVNFADYAEATRPSTVSLPLENSGSGVILHVTIQRMKDTVDERDVEENGDVRVNSKDMNSNHNPTEDRHLNKTSLNTEQNGSFTSNGSIAALASTSDTISTQNILQNFGLKNTTVQKDPTSIPSSLRQNSMPQKRRVNATTTKDHTHRQPNTDWSVSPAADGSLDDLTNSPEDSREKLQDSSNGYIEKLKSEIVILSRQAEVTELELQSLRKQTMKESKRGQDLSRQISSLKQERDALKTECEHLQSMQKCIDETEVLNKLQLDSMNSMALLEEIRQELNHEKDLNTTLRLRLQRTEESNFELILTVRDLDEMLEQKNREISHLLSKIETNKDAKEVHEKVTEWKLNDEDQQAQELVTEDNNAKEIDSLREKIKDLYGEIEVCRKDRHGLQMHVEQLSLDNGILKQENHNISTKLEQNELLQRKIQNDSSASLTTIKELERQIEILEKEHKMKAQEFLESLDKNTELETQVKSLEKELKRQAHGFEDDLEAMTCAKIEQEQKAIQAEEALRKTRWNNANTVERLQEELRRLSVEMESKFDENEKLAMKAMVEANELHLQNKILEEMLQKENKEFELTKDQYGVKMQELLDQIDLKEKQIEQMSLELDDKSRQLEYATRNEKEKHEAFSTEIQTLKAEIDKLTREKYDSQRQAEQKEKSRNEMEQMKTSIGETEMLIQRLNTEREELERKFASVKEEAGKTQEELTMMRCLKEEKETMVGILLSEAENLRGECKKLKHHIYEEELERENLRKQVAQLNSDLQKKEEAIISIEKKLKDNNGRRIFSDIRMTLKNKKTTPLSCDSKEVVTLMEKLMLLEEQIKLKEAALEKSTNSFLAKERDLSNKMEELERSVKQLNHSKGPCEDHFQKKAGQVRYVTTNACKPDEGRSMVENLPHSENSITTGNGVAITPVGSKLNFSNSNTSNACNFTELLTEVALLKERNKSMEDELKEMQERYSEISLKFAEVEGERQQLVMTLRNLKNAKKN